MISAVQQPLQTIEATLARLLHCTPQRSAIASAIISEHTRAALRLQHRQLANGPHDPSSLECAASRSTYMA